jgi:4-hydroxy-tetrahydrodipicolinate synthase
MNSVNFRGTGVALITPFKSDLTIDYSSLEKLINFNIENGIDYFVSLGTTGESVTLSKEEKKAVWKFTAEKVKGRIPLVAGIGGNNTMEIIESLKEFEDNGFDAILSVSPYYNKPTQEGIYRHFMEIGKGSPLPVILYNVPGRTSSNITAETTLRIAKANEKFIGIKEASGIFLQIMRIVEQRPSKDFYVISGDDLIALPLLSIGCDGVISVVAQAFPKDFSTMILEGLAGNYATAQKLHYQLMDMMEWFFAESSPAGVKAALHQQDICENVLRLPLVPVTEKLYKKISDHLLIAR